jgi:hypothetical protein
LRVPTKTRTLLIVLLFSLASASKDAKRCEGRLEIFLKLRCKLQVKIRLRKTFTAALNERILYGPAGQAVAALD